MFTVAVSLEEHLTFILQCVYCKKIQDSNFVFKSMTYTGLVL